MITSKTTAHTVSTISLNFCQEIDGTRNFLSVEIVSHDTLAGLHILFSEYEVVPNPADPSENKEVYDEGASTWFPVTDIESAVDHFTSRHLGMNVAMAKQHLANLLNAYVTFRSINSLQGLTLGQ